MDEEDEELKLVAAFGAAKETSTWNQLVEALLYAPKLEKVSQVEGADLGVELNVNWSNFLLALILIMLMLTTAIGNLFVIVAILIERNLRTIGNYLVLSLAIADLLVACLVMPLAGIYQILDRWTLGVLLCDIWTSTDVFCCTASILHLLAIALDRYWAVTRVDYIRCQRNERRILFMIFFVWMAACIISLAPVFGWKDDQFEWRITKQFECLISQDIGYQIFATCTTFYCPLTLTLIFYWKIYQVARKRIRQKPGNRLKLALQHPSSSSSNSSPSAKQANNQTDSTATIGIKTNIECQSIVKCSPLGSQCTSLLHSKSPKEAAYAEDKQQASKCLCACHLEAPDVGNEIFAKETGQSNGNASLLDRQLRNATRRKRSQREREQHKVKDSDLRPNSGERERSMRGCSKCGRFRLEAHTKNHLDRQRCSLDQSSLELTNKDSAADFEEEAEGAPEEEDDDAEEDDEEEEEEDDDEESSELADCDENNQDDAVELSGYFDRACDKDADTDELLAGRKLELDTNSCNSSSFADQPPGSSSGPLPSGECGDCCACCCTPSPPPPPPPPPQPEEETSYKRAMGILINGRGQASLVSGACARCGCSSALVDNLDLSVLAASTAGVAFHATRDRVGVKGEVNAQSSQIQVLACPNSGQKLNSTLVQTNQPLQQSLGAEGIESKRERKAAKTLAIITGVFVMCWLPFFIMAILMPLLNIRPHRYVFALLLWLGYANSMLNPIIYTIFSPDFRKAFKRLLCGGLERRQPIWLACCLAGCLNQHNTKYTPGFKEATLRRHQNHSRHNRPNDLSRQRNFLTSEISRREANSSSACEQSKSISADSAKTIPLGASRFAQARRAPGSVTNDF